MAWFIVGSIIGLLLETVTGPWWRVAYEALVGGNSLGLIVYVNGGAYLLAEELDMIISRLNRLKDQDQFRAEGEAEGRQQGRQEGRAEGRQQGREEGQAEGLQQGREEGQAAGLQQGRQEGQAEVESEIESVRQTLTPEQLDSLPPAVRDLLQRPSGRNNGNGSYRR